MKKLLRGYLEQVGKGDMLTSLFPQGVLGSAARALALGSYLARAKVASVMGAIPRALLAVQWPRLLSSGSKVAFMTVGRCFTRAGNAAVRFGQHRTTPWLFPSKDSSSIMKIG